jgi:rhombotail lipoprotein
MMLGVFDQEDSKMKWIYKIGTTTAILIFLSACQSTSNFQNSSVVEYLYPRSRNQQVSTEIPLLTLPLRVGIAFTPSGYGSGSGFVESKKVELLSSISEHFKNLEFVKSIEVIPSGYLRPAGSFENLDQLKRMFNVDVIALVSFDQTRFTDEGLASLAYWTIVGAYIIPAEKNTTYTMMDTVLYDIASRKLLFRAPGTSNVKSNATLVNLQEQTRVDSLDGFTAASEDLVGNLKIQLEIFREKVKQSPEEYKIAKSAGYRGSGSSNLLLVLLSAFLVIRRLRKWPGRQR